jgi:magnesium transporter
MSTTRLISRRTRKIGLPEGSIVHLGERKTERVKMTVIEFDEQGAVERVVQNVGDLPPPKRERGVAWIDVEGLHDTAVIEAIGKRYGIHPLVLEDIVNTGGRLKAEDVGEFLFVRTRATFLHKKDMTVQSEQVSFLLGERLLISFQECPMDIFDPVQSRLKEGKGRIRTMGADYLLYALLDEVVDNYFPVLEAMGDRVEALEDELTDRPTKKTLLTLHELRREMAVTKKCIWPMREIVALLTRHESPLITDATTIYFRDIYDHVVQIMDTAEMLRDMLSGMLDIYLSSMSNRINEIMRVLTLIATIFMPITFIVGVYGMNFEYMPELGWRWGYPAIWAVMLLISGGMIQYFRKQKWL